MPEFRTRKDGTVYPVAGGKEYRRDYLGSQERPKIVVRTQVDGTIITYEQPTYVGYIILPSGRKVPRYMNKEEAERWSKETGNPVKELR